MSYLVTLHGELCTMNSGQTSKTPQTVTI